MLTAAGSISAPADFAEKRAGQGRGYFWLGLLMVSYIGVYLCRKNLAVAAPLIREEWGASKEAMGMVASISTLVYALGKVALGPIVDLQGGKSGLLWSMVLVAVFGAFGGAAPSLAVLTLVYSMNRLAGAASWGSMVKLVPDWFSRQKLGLAMGVLSLSYVFGGAIGTGVAGAIARFSHDNWRMVLGLPSAALLLLAAAAWLALPRRGSPASASDRTPRAGFSTSFHEFVGLWRDREFAIICALSFALTFVRETFGFWAVDYFRSEAGKSVSTAMAAFLSMPFDLCGAFGILTVGWLFGVVSHRARRWILFLLLCGLGTVLIGLPIAAKSGLTAATVAVGAVGFLTCGPYSLLAGVFAVDVRGPGKAATVAGWVDGVGYGAGVLSGAFFGRLLTWGGYPLGFQVMAGLAFVGAVISLCISRQKPSPALVPAAAEIG